MKPNNTEPVPTIDEILVKHRNGTINPDPRKWCTSPDNDFRIAKAQIERICASERLTAYDEALFDSGYDKRQVGPVTREIVDGKRSKLQTLIEETPSE